MRSILILGVLCAVCVCLPAGCGNVTLRGEALTAAETSAMDAYQAAQRAGATATTQPTWEQSYLVENFKQWRYFVRAARKDLNWGPRLPSDSN